ncbi:amidohydrolase family protein [Microterricola viridarii]|nr:amidohydrolase family protein [Microterricola viridarii]
MASTMIVNVRLFDGTALTSSTTVGISDELITTVGGPPPGNTLEGTVDGNGGVLLPGLIDAHVHVDDEDQLQAFLAHGITTVLDMANQKPEITRSLRELPGLPQVFGAGLPASAPGGAHTTKMGFPLGSAVKDGADARRFVAARVRDHADFIKIIVEDPRMPGTKALPADTIAALVQASHSAGLLTVAHAVTSTAVGLAAEAGVDVITHAPMNRSITPGEAVALAARGAALVPTLTMLRGTAGIINARSMFRLLRRLNIAPPVHYENARQSVAVARAAGLAVAAGTDSNSEVGAPWHPRFGSSLHDELELLVDAGLSPAEAIAAATATPARIFGLTDRGAIAPGLRADLLLIRGDPTAEISAARTPAGIWIGGQRVL